jgi:uncharacterized protein (DUF305 family)
MKQSNLVWASTIMVISLGLSNGALGAEADATSSSSHAGHGAMVEDAANPYGAAEMAMHQRMMSATGKDASETWVRKMIEHHRGAIEMSDTLIKQGGDPAIVEKARKAADMQRKEIAELQQLIEPDQ